MISGSKVLLCKMMHLLCVYTSICLAALEIVKLNIILHGEIYTIHKHNEDRKETLKSQVSGTSYMKTLKPSGKKKRNKTTK